jgi:hypothetical protein
MPKGRLYDWEGIATMERQNPETRWVESSFFSICVSSLSLIDAQKTLPKEQTMTDDEAEAFINEIELLRDGDGKVFGCKYFKPFGG